MNADSVDDVIDLSERLVSDEVSIDDAIKQILTKYPQFGTKQEQDEEKPKPTFAAAGNPAAASVGGEVDPFQSIIDSYRKKKG